jgi:hypothetical protein
MRASKMNVGAGRAVAERCTIEIAELILGLKRRNVEATAARGEIPGAAKLGHLWTFNVGQLRRYVTERQQCTGKHRQDAFGVGAPFGVASMSTATKSDDRYTQATRRLRHSAVKQRKSA